MKKLVSNMSAFERKLFMVIADILAFYISFGLALWLRFDLRIQNIPRQFLSGYLVFCTIGAVITLAGYKIMKLYQSVWSYAGTSEIVRTFFASSCTVLMTIAVTLLAARRMPISFYCIGWLLVFLSTAFIRVGYRLMRRFNMTAAEIRQEHGKNVMVIGAGAAGLALIREYRTSSYIKDKVCCLIDDNQNKWGCYLADVKIVGGREKIAKAADEYHIDKIVLAIPSANRKTRKALLDICQTTGREVLTVPGMFQLVNGEVSVSQLRSVDTEDLLGRDQIHINLEEILGYVKGKVVLVTGGGGSIGSELCRQLANHDVKRLIIFDIYENNAYEIQQELKRNHPELDLVVLIGSVRNTHRINEVMRGFRPDLVYHAAAHKHVPLMEDSPNEAIKNNVFGTYKTAIAAGECGVERFVLISSDKAVNPTNIMGASKRMCEMIVQTLNRHYETDYVAVRFGNVLGSNGSVLPLFKKQIAMGGPVTVTHPDIIRYFMTISEAVSLVLEAGAYAKGGEIFVLDMGEPVRIADLARNLIELSGLKVGEDIEIQYTGLRPGEKLYEELLMDEEGMQETANKLIHIGKPIEMDEKLFLRQLDRLSKAADNDSRMIKQLVKDVVSTYVYKDEPDIWEKTV